MMPLILSSLLTYTRVTGHGDEPVLWFGLGILTENVSSQETWKQFQDLLPQIHLEISSQLAQLSSHIQHCIDRTKTPHAPFLVLSEAHPRKVSWGHSGTYTGISDKNHCRQSAPLWGTRNSSGFCLFWKKQLNCEHATSYIINVDIWLPNTDKFVGVFDATTFFMELRLFLALLFH